MDSGSASNEKHQTTSDDDKPVPSYTSSHDGGSVEDQNGGQPQKHKLKRSLKTRHLTMIALGGVIGQGLFLSAGANLNHGGPAGALIAYAIVGFIVFWVAYSLGEMATYIPVSGSFTIFCRRFVDDSFGCMVGYNYWGCWAIIVAAELVALPLVMQFWTSAVPDWAWSLIFLVVIFLLNLFGARSYGETEYWFSMIKVLAVIIFIIVGACVSGGLIGYISFPVAYGFKYWENGGAFPHGVLGVIDSFVLASFSMQGTEIIGITAGECSNPLKQVPRAIKTVFWRIIIFYLGSVFIMGQVIPWDDPHNLNTKSGSATVSPFTLVFEKGSLASVAHIMNVVILITVLSCANSGLYVSSRTMLALAEEGIAWKKLAYISKRGVPVYALICTALVSLVTFVTSVIPGKALYQVLVSLSGIAGFVTWGSICLAHFRFRQAFKAQGRSLDILPFKAIWHPFGDIFDMFACVVCSLITGYSYFYPPDAVGLVGNYAGLVMCAVGFGFAKWWTRSKMVPLTEIDLDTGVSELVTEKHLRDEMLEERAITGTWSQRIWKRIVIVFT
ncbi:amino acid permease/ SLC12A domain-containing protein [Zychaea mexicana]|uniref:amino acid permease/ SLC12A domain-containing protein n=1 Tax=Zychaea mexicana TaxID=64656 RepID=UPI0022FE6322|nr:amino acid permease/ SLC12A domain-containing protein [Zychaea mexicana]KAI9489403.1 amino acid permease/ SLC12A domain-containing protein [Zychaea mexicana]